MANSKKGTKDRSKKQQQFKAKAKQEAAQQAIPRTHLVPVPTWQSNENLDFRGDLLEALEQQLMAAMDAVQKCGQVAQMVMQMNIKNEKIKINYVWNNGEPATEAEVETHKGEMKKLQEERNKQLLQMQDKIKQDFNAAKTGLVDAAGNPVGSTQNLDENEESGEEANSDEQPSDNAGGETAEE